MLWIIVKVDRNLLGFGEHWNVSKPVNLPLNPTYNLIILLNLVGQPAMQAPLLPHQMLGDARQVRQNCILPTTAV